MNTLSDPMLDQDFWWKRKDLDYRDGRLCLAGHDVAQLAEDSGRPLYLYSLDRALANLERVRTALADTGQSFQVYYAMKANRFPALLERLAASGACGIDVCSPAELELALSCGFSPAQASYTGTGVSARDLDRLLHYPDLTVNCDTIGMIRRIGEREPGRSIGVRVNPAVGTGYADNDRLTYAGEATTKFGIYREQWAHALEMADRYDLTVTSLHFHVGCGYLTNQLDRWDEAVGCALRFLDDVPDVTLVNVGGGLGLPHRAGDKPLDLKRWSAILRRHFAGRPVTIAVEPGDYIVKDAGILVLCVVDVERKRDTTFVSVDGGFNLHPEPAFYDLPCEPVPCERKRGVAAAAPVTIAGNINEALDIWTHDVSLPPLDEGDFIAFLNAGGYGAAMSSNHCMRGDFEERAV